MVVPDVVGALELELGELEKISPGASRSTLAHTCRALAFQLDNDPSPNAAALVAKELRGCLAELRGLAPAEREEDTIGALTKQAAARGAAAKGRKRS